MNDSPFARHRIVDSLVTPTFGTWLCKRKREGEDNEHEYDSAYWFRVFAGDRKLVVTGDFDPTVFAYGPVDPISLVCWMGREGRPTSYAMEKAGIGLGGRRHVVYDVDAAREDLRELRDDERKRRVQQAESDEDVDEPKLVQVLNEALELRVDYDGLIGVHELRRAVLDEYDEGDYWEALVRLGERPAESTRLALQALERLVELLGLRDNDTAR